MKIEIFLLLIMVTFASEQNENATGDLNLVKIEEDEYTKAQKGTSKYIGVSYTEANAKWLAVRWSRKENKSIYNGHYDDEEKAAHASDTLARKLMADDKKQNLKLNFPEDDTEVHSVKNISSTYIGVTKSATKKRWQASRWSRKENKPIYNGYYSDEKTAAHASDTVARKLMTNGKQNYKLNFPEDVAEVHSKKNTSSNYIGVSYDKCKKKWESFRYSRNERKVHIGYYIDEERAAHASDTLARKLMGDDKRKKLKLNFPDNDIEVYQKIKRKRSELEDVEHSQNK